MLMNKTIPWLLLASLSAHPVMADETAAPVAPPAGAATGTATPEQPKETPPRYDGPNLKNPPPMYSDISRQLGEKGKVVVLALVSREGLLQDAKISESSGFPRLDVQAIDTVTAWRFEPATRDGKPVLGTVKIPLEFGLAAEPVKTAAPQIGDPPPVPQLDSNFKCSTKLPEVKKWLTLITEAPHPPEMYPKPINDRATEVSPLDPHFEFDSGRSPYHAYELPAYNQPYKIVFKSTVNPKLFYPVLVFLDRKLQPTRCLVKALDTFKPADWAHQSHFYGEVNVDRASRKDRYLLIYTTPELAEKSTDPKSSYNMAGLLTDWIGDMVSANGGGNIDMIKHSYYGWLTIKTKPIVEKVQDKKAEKKKKTADAKTEGTDKLASR